MHLGDAADADPSSRPDGTGDEPPGMTYVEIVKIKEDKVFFKTLDGKKGQVKLEQLREVDDESGLFFHLADDKGREFWASHLPSSANMVSSGHSKKGQGKGKGYRKKK